MYLVLIKIEKFSETVSLSTSLKNLRALVQLVTVLDGLRGGSVLRLWQEKDKKTSAYD